MSAGGTMNPPSAAGETGNSPLTSEQSPQQGGPQVDRSMGFGRQFQQPSFINPFMGGYGFGQPFGGFNNPYGGFSGGFGSGFGGGFGSSFGMGLGGLYGGYSPMPYGGYQSYQPPQQQQQGPGNAYTKPMPQPTIPYQRPLPQPGGGSPAPQPSPSIDYSTMPIGRMGGGAEYWRPGGGRDQQAAATEQWRASQSQSGGGNAPPPGMMLNPNYNPSKAMLTNVPMPGSKEALERQMYIPATAGTANPYGTPPADGGGYKTGFTSFNDLQEQLRLEKQYRDNPIKLDSKGQPIISSPFDNPQGSPYGTPPAGGGMNRPGVMDDSILGRYSGSSYGGAPMTQGPESMFYNMGGLGSLFGGGGFRYY